MFLKLMLGAAAVAAVAFVAPVSAAPLTPQPNAAEEGLVQQVGDDDYRWRRRRYDYDDYRYRRRHDDYGHHRHCRRVCYGSMHWNSWRGWHCHGHWHVRCHHHHY